MSAMAFIITFVVAWLTGVVSGAIFVIVSEYEQWFHSGLKLEPEPMCRRGFMAIHDCPRGECRASECCFGDDA